MEVVGCVFYGEKDFDVIFAALSQFIATVKLAPVGEGWLTPPPPHLSFPPASAL